MVSSRKRRRISSDSGVPPHVEQKSDAHPRSGKEIDIWETFREEYIESVEQLPLSLHRNFSLLNQIDVQAHGVQSILLPKIKNYVEERRAAQRANFLPNSPSGALARNSVAVENNFEGPTPSNGRHNALRKERQIVQSDNRLADISKYMNVLLRATEEKVNLAQAVYDSVDRHVRLLDQTISDHSLHDKIDTHTQKARNNLLPFPNTSAHGVADHKEDVNIILGTQQGGQGSGKQKLTKVHPLPIDKMIGNGHRPTRRELKGPSANSVSAAVLSSDMPVDPNEPVYCYCRSVSFGEMIACDAEDCEYEWFHLDCVVADGKVLDKSKQWFCKLCRDRVTSGARRRG